MCADVAGRQIAAVGPDAAPQRRVTRALDADPAADAEAIARLLIEPNLQPVTAGANLIEKQPDRSVVGGEDDIDVAVVVDVAERRAATHLGEREGRPRHGA